MAMRRVVPLAGQLLGVRLIGGVDRLDDRVRPGVEARLVARGHAQELADHRDRDGVGEVVDDVDRTGLQGVDLLVDQPTDLRFALQHEPGIARRAELTHGDPTQPVVVGRILSDERRDGREIDGHGAVRLVGADPRIMEKADDLLVRGDDVRTVVLDGHGVLELRVQAVGIRTARGIADLVEECGDGHGAPWGSMTLAWAPWGACPESTTVGVWYATDGCGNFAGTGPSGVGLSSARRSSGRRAADSISRR